VADLGFFFRDSDFREHISQVAVTVAEPFSNTESLTGATEFIGCEKVGFFRPTTLFDRNEKQLSDLRVLVEREPREFPLGGEEWDLELGELAQREARNPWQALLVYIEGRGSLSGAPDVEKETLVAGCQCVRFKEDLSSGNPELDRLIEDACLFVGKGASSDVEIELGPLPPSAVNLEPCRSPEFVIVDEPAGTEPESLKPNLSPGLCIYFNSCSAGQVNCVDCVHPSMDPKCSDRSQVPIELSLSQNSGVELKNTFVLTDEAGVVRPEFRNVQNCNGTFQISAKIAGRDTLAQTFSVYCAKEVRFEPPTKLAVGDLSGQVPLMSVLPGEAALGIPSSLVTLGVSESNGVKISVLDVVGETLRESHTASLAATSSTSILALHGYAFRANATSASVPERTIPLLAVVTGENELDQVRLKLTMFEREGAAIRKFDESSQPCGRCACDARDVSCEACESYFLVNKGQEMTIRHADMNADGYNDLIVGRHAGPSDVFVMNVYSSGASAVTQENLPRLNNGSTGGNCSCYNLGSKSDGFEVLRWGGSENTRDLHNVDIVFARPIGGAAQYARGIRAQGELCDPQVANSCGSGAARQCVEIQSAEPGVGVCLETCADGTCLLSPTLTICADENSGAPAEIVDYCVGEGLACLSPTSFWNYFFIEDLKRGQFTSSPYQDVVLIGKFENTNEVRVFFGGTHNHVNLGSSDRAARNSIQTTLLPRSEGSERAPSDAKSIAVADLNGDGVDDIAVLYTKPSNSRRIKIWLGTPSGGSDADKGVRALGELLSSIDVSSPELGCDNAIDLVAKDFDADGLADIALLCRGRNAYEVAVFRSKVSN